MQPFIYTFEVKIKFELMQIVLTLKCTYIIYEHFNNDSENKKIYK